MTPSPARLRLAFGTAGAIALLIAGSALLDAGARSPRPGVEERIIAPVQRVVAPASGPEALPDLVDAACPAIVTLVHSPATRGRTERIGGIVISAHGAILASGHGLRPGDRVDVAFNELGNELGNDPSIRPGLVAVVDDLSGLAIVQVEASGLKALAFDDADLPRAGRWGFTLSSPAGRGCAVRTGAIMQDFTSADDGPRGWIATTIDPPARGAAFIGRNGRVLGFATVAGSGTAGFLPANIVSRIASAMARGGEEPAAPFGLVVDQPGPTMARRLRAGRQKGAVVMLVAPRSPAAQAGIVAGDIILTAGGAPVATSSELERILNAAAGSIDLTVQRRGRLSTLALER